MAVSPFILNSSVTVKSPSPRFVMFPKKSPSPHKSVYSGFSLTQHSSSMRRVSEARASQCGFKELASRTPWPLLAGCGGPGTLLFLCFQLHSPDSLASLWLLSLREKNLAPTCVCFARSDLQMSESKFMVLRKRTRSVCNHSNSLVANGPVA